MLRDPGLLADTLAPVERAALAAFVLAARGALAADLRRLAVYGSRARGDQHPDSDIDVLAVVAGDGRAARHRLRRLAAELNLQHDTSLAVLVLSELEWAGLRDRERRLALDVEREGIDL
jgi:predicted nucleotidyltransferase